MNERLKICPLCRTLPIIEQDSYSLLHNIDASPRYSISCNCNIWFDSIPEAIKAYHEKVNQWLTMPNADEPIE